MLYSWLLLLLFIHAISSNTALVTLSPLRNVKCTTHLDTYNLFNAPRHDTAFIEWIYSVIEDVAWF